MTDDLPILQPVDCQAPRRLETYQAFSQLSHCEATMTALLLTVAMTVPAPALTVADWQTAHERFPRWIPAPPAQDVGPVERWRPLVEDHFDAEHVDDALSVIACESEGNPDARHPGSHASGLFQAMPQWFTGRGWFEPSPFGAFDPFDPAENVRFAAWLFYDTGATWGPWVCRPD